MILTVSARYSDSLSCSSNGRSKRRYDSPFLTAHLPLFQSGHRGVGCTGHKRRRLRIHIASIAHLSPSGCSTLYDIHRAGYQPAETLISELSLARSLLETKSSTGILPVGVGYLGWLLDKMPPEESETLLIPALNANVQAFWFAFGRDLGKWIQYVRDKSPEKCPLIFVQVNSLDEAVHAVEHLKADVIVAQGEHEGFSACSLTLMWVICYRHRVWRAWRQLCSAALRTAPKYSNAICRFFSRTVYSSCRRIGERIRHCSSARSRRCWNCNGHTVSTFSRKQVYRCTKRGTDCRTFGRHSAHHGVRSGQGDDRLARRN